MRGNKYNEQGIINKKGEQDDDENDERKTRKLGSMYKKGRAKMEMVRVIIA